MASVRSEARAQEVLDLHPSWKSKVSFVIVSDIAADKAFNQVFEDAKTPFDYIIHTASPVTFNVTDIQKELIDPAVKGFVDGKAEIICSLNQANRPKAPLTS